MAVLISNVTVALPLFSSKEEEVRGLQSSLQAAPRKERMSQLDEELRELRSAHQQKIEELRR